MTKHVTEICDPFELLFHCPDFRHGRRWPSQRVLLKGLNHRLSVALKRFSVIFFQQLISSRSFLIRTHAHITILYNRRRPIYSVIHLLHQCIMPFNAKKTFFPAEPPLSLNYLTVPDLVWDDTQSQPENELTSAVYALHSANKSSSTFSTEHAVPSPVSSKSSSGRRWGIFSKKSGASTSVIALTLPANHDSVSRGSKTTKSKPNVLKKQHTKSTPNIKSVALRSAELGTVNTLDVPVSDPPLPTPAGSGLFLGEALSSADSRSPQLPGSAIYFTVDPSWDPSKGDADVYLLPFPDAVIESNALESVQFSKDTAPRLRTRTEAGKPRNLKSIVKTDNERSFLFFK